MWAAVVLVEGICFETECLTPQELLHVVQIKEDLLPSGALRGRRKLVRSERWRGERSDLNGQQCKVS